MTSRWRAASWSSQSTTSGKSCCKGPLDCNDGNPCTFDACLATTGTCSNAMQPDGAQCDDGTSCTSLDHCDGKGSCVGTEKDCSDGDACTDDICDPKTGQCSNEKFATVQQNFNSDTDGFSFQVQGQGANQIKWQLSTRTPSSPPTALYCGRVNALGKHDFDVGSFIATATYKNVTIPSGATTAFVRFKYRFDTSESGCGSPFTDRIELLIDGNQVAQRCDKTTGSGYEQVQFDLSGSKGKAVAVGLRFSARKTQAPLPGSNSNTGEGPWFDDFEIGWTCQ